MSITIKKILDNKFEVTINNNITTKHTIILSNNFHDSLTKNKISKKKLLEYSIKFLLDRESNTSILSFFELEIISKYFPEYKSEIKRML